MTRAGEHVFVDTGAWIALAVVRDPLHERARSTWSKLDDTGARLYTSTAVVLETFTYLDRKGSRELAARWHQSLHEIPRLKLVDFTAADLELACRYLERKDLHKLSFVDATSFVLMQRLRIRVAFSFDTHFAIAGFRLL